MYGGGVLTWVIEDVKKSLDNDERMMTDMYIQSSMGLSFEPPEAPWALRVPWGSLKLALNFYAHIQMYH